MILHEFCHFEDIITVGTVSRHAENIEGLSILREISYSEMDDHLGMATASANLLMKRSAFSSTYPRNVAGAGIVYRSLRFEVKIRGRRVVDKSERRRPGSEADPRSCAARR